ncbi:MAG: activase [Ignavibacteriae bacterium]|nr:MAG: activase [Ignavibacteriota bacterium]
MHKKSLGICIGASTISFVITEREENITKISSFRSLIHEGNPRKIISEYFNAIDTPYLPVTITGRKFKNLIKGYTIPEPQTIEESIKYLNLQGKFRCLISLGGENFILYLLSEKGTIDSVITGNKCASGTGEFFLQQIGRMNLNIEEALSFADSEQHYTVSGRCSVFCKSDCTHALNKGIEKGKVVSGLCKMIADKTIELLSKQKSKNVIAVGGVSKNKSVIDFIKKDYPSLYIPGEATYFEALGASLIGLEKGEIIDKNNIFKANYNNFSTLLPLSQSKNMVVFKEFNRQEAKENDICILGLDIGSTTTKAVITRCEDDAVLATVYLRTNGNPVGASIECYKELKSQINVPVKIKGLGTTGSGRHISALHALTDGVVNEIIAHAVAAAHFDKDVDTIFEIGGQDAKYTHLTNGIASDYAMNEACSAGTGSFLEESAKETLNINYLDIGDIALQAEEPLNFNDQCAAFISSDIKTASHEGASKENIVAGLVYSICMNYVNRVKGNKPTGRKIFMQGGVCYNKAVPYAMANLVNKEIIVPPEPGLMGAYGVALEVKKRIELGLLDKKEFVLDELINREFEHKKDFICAGGAEKCDRKCGISIYEVEGKKYPFGGACSKYYNQRHHIKIKTEDNDYVDKRQELVYEKYVKYPNGTGKTIGISKSFQTNTLYPLYYNFFARLGFKVVLSDKIASEGIDKIRSAFCYPVEIAHGFFQDLLDKKVDYIFLPHITQMDYNDGHKYKRLCVFVQGENYYLRTSFKEEKLPPILSPVIDFAMAHSEVKRVFQDIGKTLGANKSTSAEAFSFAFDAYSRMQAEFKELGKEALRILEKDNTKFGMVLFGRTYNSFAKEANLNIPHKIASKDIILIPHDFLPNEEFSSFDNMYWFSGQQILKSARFVKTHPQLFGVFITNFSCGPDSFILSYFRKIMGSKPSLTLELDSHSADVGVETRIDAAIDIIKNYLELNKRSLINDIDEKISTLKIVHGGDRISIIDTDNKEHKLTSSELEILIPAMGRFSTEAFSAMCRSFGINARPLPVPKFKTLQYGRGLTTCKECLPFILTTGSLVEYIKEIKDKDKKILFFMPHGYGPCRQGQYFIMLQEIIKDMKLKDVGVLSMNDETSFSELGNNFFIKAWQALLIADVVHDIESVILALAENKESAQNILNDEWEKLKYKIETGNNKQIYLRLEQFAEALSKIELKEPVEKAKVISLIGEIYVRREEFSRGDLVKTLIDKGFVVRTAPICEYVYYSNYLIKKGIIEDVSIKEKTSILIKDNIQKYLERKIKKILAKSNLYKFEMIDIEKTMEYASDLISEKLVGESILTTGLALREILDDCCGVISIGPFNCMPSRLSEAILNKEMTLEGKYKHGNIKENHYPAELTTLPFLYIESDGNPYPQITQSKIEIFMMQAEKVHGLLKS